MKRIILLLISIQFSLFAGIPMTGEYYGPTDRLIKREGWDKISRKILEMKVPTELFPFFDSIAKTETWGHIGYHGSNQGFRIYQDIIRLTLEEIVGIEKTRRNFHYLRVPGDPDLDLNSMDEFVAYWNKIDCKHEKRAKQLLSLNFGIYSNFDEKGSCSLNLFVNDKSKHDIDYARQLSFFFDSLGIDPEELYDLFTIGRKWFDENGGILLQLAEISHIVDPNKEAYNFSDMHGYPSKKAGYRYGEYPLSNHYDRIQTDLYINHELDIAPQLRLLLNNRYTLNPYSYLVVRRWDLYSNETVALYEEELKEAIRKLSYDLNKVESYRQHLVREWANCPDCMLPKELLEEY